MRLKKRRTSRELCIFIGLFLLIFVTIFHILLFSHTRATSYYNTNDGNVVNIGEKGKRSEVAKQVSQHAFGERLLPEAMQALAEKYNQKAITKQPDPIMTVHHRPVRHNLMAASARARMRALAQAEIRKMEKSLTALVRQNAPSPEESVNRYRSETSALRLRQIIEQSEGRSSISENRTSHNETISSAGDRFQKKDSIKPNNNVVHNEKVPLSASRVRTENGQSVPEPRKYFKELDQSEEYELKQTMIGAFNQQKVKDAEEDVLLVEGVHGWNISQDSYIEDINSGTQQRCEAVPRGLKGVTRDVHLDIEVDMDAVIKTHEDIQAGGEWKPDNCVSRHRLAIIIPYRDRWNHLKVLLYYLLPLLKRQQIHFRIFVVEQYGNQTFNKGRIMNAAYREGLKLFNFQCVIFHDVDLVPEDDRNIYTCAEHPKHMSTAVDKFNYLLPYQGLVGGVLSFRVDHFQLVNGYSNMYWGWGGEDDDMTTRILSKGLRIFRPPNNVARYKMVKHSGRSASQIRLKLLRTAARRGRVEGLNNVPYQLLFTHKEKLFTHFMVDVGKP